MEVIFFNHFKIAFATNERNGLEDSISRVFGRAETFTILDVEGKSIVEIKILDNPAKSYHHGAGPIAVKMLVDEGVNFVFSNELGFGACELLKQQNIKHISVKPDIKVGKIFREEINKLEKEGILAEI
jgi:predicted Fe-Mo cluster-binding NifX family protein